MTLINDLPLDYTVIMGGNEGLVRTEADAQAVMVGRKAVSALSGDSLTISQRVTTPPIIVPPRYLLKKNKNMCPLKHLFVNAHTNIIYQSKRGKNSDVHRQVSEGMMYSIRWDPFLL